MKKAISYSLIALLLFISACSSDDTEKVNNNDNKDTPEEITFAASSVGGFWYTLAGAMEDNILSIYPDSSLAIVEGGSIANMLGLYEGKFTIGFTSGPFIKAGIAGNDPFDEKIENVSTIATLYPTDFHLVVKEDSDIYEIEDLKGKIVSPGIKGYGGELIFKDILDVYGMSYDDLSNIEYTGTDDAAELLRDDHIDAIAGILAVPNATIQELDSTIGVRLISIDDDKIKELNEVNEGYLTNVIEEGSYPSTDEDITTVAPFSTLVVNDDLMSEDDVYEFTKMLFEERETWESLSPAMEKFSPEYSIENNVGELNPGAEKYYEEMDVLD